MKITIGFPIQNIRLLKKHDFLQIPPLKCLYLHKFFIVSQNSGCFGKVWWRVIHTLSIGIIPDVSEVQDGHFRDHRRKVLLYFPDLWSGWNAVSRSRIPMRFSTQPMYIWSAGSIEIPDLWHMSQNLFCFCTEIPVVILFSKKTHAVDQFYFQIFSPIKNLFIFGIFSINWKFQSVV
mgnify:CR=1 FL=1